MAIIYLHGFASSGETPKTAELKERFPEEVVITPTLPVSANQALRTIDNIVSKLISMGEQEFLLVGSSLGGFYATVIGKRFDIPFVVVNPAMNPSTLLRPMLGSVRNFGTGEVFEWTEDLLRELAVCDVGFGTFTKFQNSDVIIARDDDLIEVDRTINFFRDGHDVDLHIYETGGHRFDNMDELCRIIQRRLDILRGTHHPMADVDI